MINLINKPSQISKKTYSTLVEKIASDYSYELKQITCIYLTDEQLLEMNKEHLNHDYYTDIITFDLSQNKFELEGELYISTERVKDNAGLHKTEFVNEMYRVMIHGILHLVGLNDQTTKEQNEIRIKEDHYLTLLT